MRTIALTVAFVGGFLLLAAESILGLPLLGVAAICLWGAP